VVRGHTHEARTRRSVSLGVFDKEAVLSGRVARTHAELKRRFNSHKRRARYWDKEGCSREEVAGRGRPVGDQLKYFRNKALLYGCILNITMRKNECQFREPKKMCSENGRYEPA